MLKEITLKINSTYGKKGDKIMVTERAAKQIPEDEKVLERAIGMKKENKFEGDK